MLALCILLKIGCLSPGSARNGKHFSPFVFIFGLFSYEGGENADLCNDVHSRSPLLSLQTFFSIEKIKPIHITENLDPEKCEKEN